MPRLYRIPILVTTLHHSIAYSLSCSPEDIEGSIVANDTVFIAHLEPRFSLNPTKETYTTKPIKVFKGDPPKTVYKEAHVAFSYSLTKNHQYLIFINQHFDNEISPCSLKDLSSPPEGEKEIVEKVEQTMATLLKPNFGATDSGRWTRFVSDNDLIEVHFDLATIRRKKDVFEVWRMTNVLRTNSDRNPENKSEKSLLIFNCKEETYRTARKLEFDRHNAAGRLVASTTRDRFGFRPIQSFMPESKLMKQICG